jgi:hypothetical protein
MNIRVCRAQVDIFARIGETTAQSRAVSLNIFNYVALQNGRRLGLVACSSTSQSNCPSWAAIPKESSGWRSADPVKVFNAPGFRRVAASVRHPNAFWRAAGSGTGSAASVTSLFEGLGHQVDPGRSDRFSRQASPTAKGHGQTDGPARQERRATRSQRCQADRRRHMPCDGPYRRSIAHGRRWRGVGPDLRQCRFYRRSIAVLDGPVHSHGLRRSTRDRFVEAAARPRMLSKPQVCSRKPLPRRQAMGPASTPRRRRCASALSHGWHQDQAEGMALNDTEHDRIIAIRSAIGWN